MADAVIPEELYELRAEEDAFVQIRHEGPTIEPVLTTYGWVYPSAYVLQVGRGKVARDARYGNVGASWQLEQYLPGRGNRVWEVVTLVADIGSEVRKGDLLGIYRSRPRTDDDRDRSEDAAQRGCWTTLIYAAGALAVVAVIVAVVIISIGGGGPIQQEPPGVIDRGSGAPSSSASAGETYRVGQDDNTAPPIAASPNQCQAPMDGGGFAFRAMTPANSLAETLALRPTGSIDLRVQLDPIGIAEVRPEDMRVTLDPGGDLAQWARLSWDPGTVTATVERGIGVDAFPAGSHLLSVVFEHQPADPPPHPYRCAIAFQVEVS